jgi:hypothetical protein
MVLPSVGRHRSILGDLNSRKRWRKGKFPLSVWTGPSVFSWSWKSKLLALGLSISDWYTYHSQFSGLLNWTELHHWLPWYFTLQTTDHRILSQCEPIPAKNLFLYISVHILLVLFLCTESRLIHLSMGLTNIKKLLLIYLKFTCN